MSSAKQRLRAARGRGNVDFEVNTPTLYEDQIAAYMALGPEQYSILRCGRRWGKTAYGGCWAIGGEDGGLARGENVGWFAPSYKIMSEVYYELAQMLDPIKLHSSKTDGVIRTVGGGRLDFWTLENVDAGRSRKYHRIVIDEAAFTNNETMMDQWEKAIEPTLADYNGRVLVCSNTNGVDPENFLYRLSPGGGDQLGKYKFREYHAPSTRNPYLSKEFLANKKANSHPLVWRQEYLAEFVDWSGVAFFSLDKMLLQDQAIVPPTNCDAVYAVVDTAAKTGKDNDGTAVTFFAITKVGAWKLVVLDWDISQIEGAMLEAWLPTVFRRLEELAVRHKARGGSLGVWIEDKTTGIVLLQQAQRKWPQLTHPIDTKLTAMGKDERAINISGYHYRGLVKITTEAYNKVTTYKDISRNHFISQVTGFRVGDKAAATRADDLLDTYTYGVAIALGNAEGF